MQLRERRHLMLGIHDFWLFVGTSVLLNITPGPDTLYILGRSMAEGRKSGTASALGISTGSLVHTLAAALGISAILTASATAFIVVKMLGAAYLVYLGIRMLVTRKAPGVTRQPEHEKLTGKGLGSAFKQGMLTNVLNPKVALFFLAFMPQFIDADSPAKFAAFLLLGFTFVTTGTLWCLGLVWASSAIGEKLRDHPAFETILNKAAGLLFITLGVRLAVSR